MACRKGTSIHWHGLEVPIEGKAAFPIISQKPIAARQQLYTYDIYRFIRKGRFSTRTHSAMQEMIGQIGFFIAHPQTPYAPHADHDYGIVLQEWAVLPGSSVPNTAAMEYNWLTFNGLSAPATTPLIVRLGSRVHFTFRKSPALRIIIRFISTATNS